MMDVVVRPSEKVQQMLLAAVEKATRVRSQATVDQYSAIREAYAAGVPVTHIASSAGMSRQYIHRILREQMD